MRLDFYKIIFLTLLITVVPAWARPALAVSPSSISVDVAPPSPAPNDNVTITLSSYAANLDTVSISWSVNGKAVASGIGQKSFSTAAGAAGSKTTVVAKIALPDGEIDKNVIISPAVMVLLWQATDSYVPPFYRGKALLPSESEVKVVAIPEIKVGGVLANPKNMTYTWQKDFNNVADASSYGKNSYTFTNDYLDDTSNISVTASTLDQNYSSESNINITDTQPRISFYKKDPTLGTLWELALPDTYNLQGNGVVVAEPYFISPKNLWRSELTFRWLINNLAVSAGNNPYEKNLLPLKVPAGTSGTSKLSVEVDSTSKLSLTASKEINVQF